jgi:RNA polymerase sigma-70 factor (ECF subfamily)
VVTLNRAVAVAKVAGPEAALAMIEPLASRLSGYFHFFGLRGGLLLQLGRREEARAAFDRAIALPIPRPRPPISACTSTG